VTNPLARLLNPKSIAVFGGGWAAAVIRQTRKMGFAGGIWPVHPEKAEVEGLPAYKSVAALPGAPDACFIGVNRFLTIDVVRDLAARGAGGAICFASGFKEDATDAETGAKLHDALIEAAGTMPVLGPNCYGLLNYADGVALWPDQHGGRRLDPGATGAAIVTQSSNIALNMTMQARGLPLAFVMTAGNQAQTGVSGIALGLIEDPRVSVLGLHVEGFDSIAGFERLATRARALGKAVVALKVGRSEQARAATISHTASLAGNDAASDAFLARLGFARVSSIPAFLETLKMLHAVGPLSGARLSSMSCSGGEASVMADAAHGRAVGFPALAADHAAAVKATLGTLVAIANPLDYHTFIWNDRPAMERTFTAFTAGPFDLNLLVLDFPRIDRCSDADWINTVDAFQAALKTNNAKGAVVASMPENLPEAWAVDLMARGIAPLHGIGEALDAADAAAFIGAANLVPTAVPVAPARPNVGAKAVTVDEARAKARLRAAGLPVPDGVTCTKPSDAPMLAAALGFPVAVKALGIAHKSEMNAVRLNLPDAAAVRDAALALAPLGSGVYVERMVKGAVAELIVGVSRDNQFGLVMTVGSGGVLVELLADTRTLLLPASKEDIEAALRDLKLFALLAGFRGRPKADLPAAIDAIAAIGAYALAHQTTLLEMDVNPLIVCAEGESAWIADALIVETDDE
jgi:acetate---CoA ligase (ADP-forming)